MADENAAKDWRGTVIEVGALVIYGAPVGRSIAMVEAEVVGFTKSGRVNVRVLRRAFGGYGDQKEIVHVGADRLTIVDKLPPSEIPLESEKSAIAKAERIERDRIAATHRFPPVDYSRGITYRDILCSKCLEGYYEGSKTECTG